MKKLSLSLFMIAIASVLLSFTTPQKKVAIPTVTEIGYQKDGMYYYTFYADLSKASPNPITYMQIQKVSNGKVLTLDDFSGTVLLGQFQKFTINKKMTVSFYDGDKLITKDLTGLIEGAILP
ncbi:hypothetical protein SAMN05518672_10373 [Chitinophaga sp. CF118]|uniref:hypothetical protein n=1 Tax=Chitinophaga sp. CF118 TaxID=1884367 RepID=UPI0008E04FAA|nr:hypothetical protein [Chitinophaga sp. CF118]SFD75356.1 hypothetical protein SAMN05518672_10373 [Chitinophaga sp. CF118]